MKELNKSVLKSPTNKKEVYTKPTLQKYGSITQLTAGTGGSISDVTDPFSSRTRS